MKTVKNMCFQGDVLFRRIDALPPGVVEQKAEGRVVVAHSETGHHHAIEPGEAKLFERAQRDPMVCFLAIDGEHADVVHHRANHTHETVRLLQGLWEVKRQREHAPEGWRQVQD
jgi:hypothetical protein